MLKRGVASDNVGRLIQSPFRHYDLNSGTTFGATSALTALTEVRVQSAFVATETGADSGVFVISSTSANDAAAGTGARTILVTYLGNGFVKTYNTEVMTLNGTTPVSSVAIMGRVEKMEVLTTGSGGANAGRITGTFSAAAVVIGTGENRAFQCIHYLEKTTTGVATRSKACIYRVRAAATVGSASFRLLTKLGTYAITYQTQVGDILRVNAGEVVERVYDPPLEVYPDYNTSTSHTAIYGYVTPDSTTSSQYYMSFDWYTAPNP